MRTPLPESLRHPLLTEAGRRLLVRLQEHGAAPRYNFACGDQLDGPTLERVREYEASLYTAPYQKTVGALSDSLSRFVSRCQDTVPFYRRFAGLDFRHIPPLRRSDIQDAPWMLVPDDEPLDPMLAYDSSGTEGSKLWVMSHPFVSSAYLALLRRVLDRHGVRLEGGADRVALAMVSYQQDTLTYATVSSFLDQAGFVKLNLHPAEWRDGSDRARFLDDCDPQVYTGNPVSFAELARLPLKRRPRALVSSSMTLLPGLKADLESHFGCPVVDIYSMCECRAVAASSEAGLAVMRPDVYVEILDDQDQPCPEDVRGEITVTSSLNPFLPLLRYRTGDHARLRGVNGVATLVDLEGRLPTVFEAANGDAVNNIDVTIALRHLPLVQVGLVQQADRSLHLRWRGDVAEAALRTAVASRFGDLPLTLQREDGPMGGKGLQYRREEVAVP